MKGAQHSLIDQMGFSDREIARRLHLLNVIESDLEQIRSVAGPMGKVRSKVVEEYYEFQLADAQIAEIIGDVDTLTRLKGYMNDYITSLFSGTYDGQYVNARLRVGKVHKRLDVRPKLYMKAHAKLQLLLDNEIDAICSVEDAEKVKGSLHKILLFDAELVFDAYVESYLTEMQSATREVEKYASQVGIKVDSMFNRLHEKSQRDSLTGLHNRRALYDFLKHECRVAMRHHLSFIVAYFDLNGFKSVNDTHGHLAGDQVLEQVAESMMTVVRSVDVPARYGGDEFCIVMPRTSLDQVEDILGRFIKDFDKKCSYPVTLSFGIIQVGPTHFEDPEEIIEKVDQLMYQAKERAYGDGGHHWQFEDREDSPSNR